MRITFMERTIISYSPDIYIWHFFFLERLAITMAFVIEIIQ